MIGAPIGLAVIVGIIIALLVSPLWGVIAFFAILLLGGAGVYGHSRW